MTAFWHEAAIVVLVHAHSLTLVVLVGGCNAAQSPERGPAGGGPPPSASATSGPAASGAPSGLARALEIAKQCAERQPHSGRGRGGGKLIYGDPHTWETKTPNGVLWHVLYREEPAPDRRHDNDGLEIAVDERGGCRSMPGE